MFSALNHPLSAYISSLPSHPRSHRPSTLNTLPAPCCCCLVTSHVWLFCNLQTVACQPLYSWDLPGKNTGVGCHFLLQGIFLTQRWNPHLLNWQVDSLPLSHQGIPLPAPLLLFSCLVVSNTLRPHGLQHARLPCPSPSPEVYQSSRPLHQWCHPAISSSDTLFTFCPQSFPASGTFPMSQLFTSGNQNTGASDSASVLPMNIQGWFPLRLILSLISLLSKGLSGVFSSTTVWRYQFFGALPSLQSSSHHHMWPQGRPQPWLYGPLSTE